MSVAPAFAPISIPEIHHDTGEVCTVSHAVVDALSVGLSLQALARNPKTPHGTREIFERVGKEMSTAARAQLCQQGAMRKAGVR